MDMDLEGEQSQNGSSQDCMPPPSNQLQNNSTETLNGATHSPARTGSVDSHARALNGRVSQFVPFDGKRNLSEPIEEENKRDEDFLREQFAAFMQMVVETWAWNVATIYHSTQTESLRLSKEFDTTMNIEREQGMSTPLLTSESPRSRPSRVCTEWFDEIHRRLQAFFMNMQSAIDALCGS